VRCTVQKALCTSGNCECCYNGLQDNIHFWTKDTACGDEIGWDFVDCVMRAKISFSAFVQIKTGHYVSMDPLSAPFMSRSTFVSCFFFMG